MILRGVFKKVYNLSQWFILKDFETVIMKTIKNI